MGDLTGGLVGVVGGYGGVGAVAAARLSAWGVAPLRVGGRDTRRTAEAAARLGAHACPVDVSNPESLAAFVRGCRVVINCAGPAVVVGDLVARAARDAGARYVDAAGDEEFHRRLEALDWPGTAVISAGMMPGLTGLLPLLLIDGVERPLRLTGWVGGRDRFTVTAALDYLAAFDRFGETFAAWRGGRRVSRAAVADPAARVPFFPGPVAATPYLSTETEALARGLGVADATWFSVFDGEHLWQALTRQPGGATVEERAARLSRAAELDLFGHDPYQLIVAELAGPSAARTLVVRGAGANELTGATAAMAAMAVLSGDVPAGVHHAADVLDPRWAAGLLAGVEVFDGPAWEAAVVEEGVL